MKKKITFNSLPLYQKISVGIWMSVGSMLFLILLYGVASLVPSIIRLIIAIITYQPP